MVSARKRMLTTKQKHAEKRHDSGQPLEFPLFSSNCFITMECMGGTQAWTLLRVRYWLRAGAVSGGVSSGVSSEAWAVVGIVGSPLVSVCAKVYVLGLGEGLSFSRKTKNGAGNGVGWRAGLRALASGIRKSKSESVFSSAQRERKKKREENGTSEH